MSLKERIIQGLGKSRSKIISYPITLLFPEAYFNSFYNNLKKRKINWNGKKTCFSLSFDCDNRADIEAIPRVLDILSSYTIKVSFAVVGLWVERFPKIHKKIIEAGHEIMNHTYSHPNNEELNPNKFFNTLSIREQREEIVKCHNTCKEILDYEVRGFRIPHFGNLYTESIYPILKELEYTYSSSTIAVRTPHFGLPYHVDGILELPLSACPKHPFGIFDTYHSFDRSRFKWHRKDFFDVFKKLVAKGIETGAFINLYFDPQDLKYFDFGGVLDYINEKRDDLWVTNYANLVDYLSHVKGIEQS
jgi:hypothetical protein